MLVQIYFFLIFKQVFLEPLCIEYKNYCLKCNQLTNICAICQIKDILIPDDNGGCIGAKKCKTGQNYCNECEQSEDLCKICDSGYFPDKNGGCTYTLNCEISYLGECLECENDYILVGENKLKICKYIFSNDFKNCKEINIEKGECEICEENYYLTKGDKTCSKIENCYETNLGICILCDKDYYLNKREESCIIKAESKLKLCRETLDGENCDICDDGIYLDENGNCSFSNFCSESEDGKCKKCIEGFYLAKNNICSNDENCLEGDKDTGICLLCDRYYYLDDIDFKCRSNLEDNEYKYCIKIENNVCVKCDSSYYLGEDDKCSSTKNCIESENGKCILCSENYYLGKDNYCSNIEGCIYSSFIGGCIECEGNYYYSNWERKCLEFDEKFYGCKYTGLEGYCLECKDEFYIRFIGNESLCIDNTQIGPFYKCALSDDEGESCEQCIEGYFLGSEDKKCSLIENCKYSENEAVCNECDEYYCLDLKNHNCIANDYLEDENIKIYFACIMTDEEGTKCEKCIEGYIVNEEGYCIDNENCEQKDNDICVKCKNKIDLDGNIIKYYCANDVFGCVEITYDNCLKCNDLNKIFYCTECEEGYFINPWGVCIKENNE